MCTIFSQDLLEKKEEEEGKKKRKEEKKINEHKGLENISDEIISETFPKGKKVPFNVQESSKIPDWEKVPLPPNNQNTKHIR